MVKLADLLSDLREPELHLFRAAWVDLVLHGPWGSLLVQEIIAEALFGWMRCEGE